jgi:hypothetical protein
VTVIQKSFAVAAALVVVAVVGFLVLHKPSPAVVTEPLAHHPAPAKIAPPQPTSPAAPQAVSPSPADQVACQPPAAAPPPPPDGNTATQAQMTQAHDAIQGYVNQLETYQSCLNKQVDDAGPTVPVEQKQIWINDGNGAVDEANLLAHGFASQLAIFNAKHPK